jgi:predicted DNA binding CopG/RHH family protein
MPKEKKDIRITIKLDHVDLRSLETGMSKVGETNMSSYIRRLIHQAK